MKKRERETIQQIINALFYIIDVNILRAFCFCLHMLEINALMLFKMQSAEVIKYGQIQNAYGHSDRQMQLKYLGGKHNTRKWFKAKIPFFHFIS